MPVIPSLRQKPTRQRSSRSPRINPAGGAIRIHRPRSTANSTSRLRLRIRQIRINQPMKHCHQPLLRMTLRIGAVGKRPLGQPTIGKSWLPLAHSLLAATTSSERLLKNPPMRPRFLELINRTNQRPWILGQLLRHPSPDDQVMPGRAKPVQRKVKRAFTQRPEASDRILGTVTHSSRGGWKAAHHRNLACIAAFLPPPNPYRFDQTRLLLPTDVRRRAI
jgi:hypothetical protein